MIVDAKINDRWDIKLPDFRAEFHAERPKWEAGRLEHMAEVVQKGWDVFDVGAEHGDFTQLYRGWVGGGVVPIEPSSAYWPCICATWHANNSPDPGANLKAPPASFHGFASDTGEAKYGLTMGEWPAAADGEVIADPGFRHLHGGQHAVPQIRLDTLAYRTGIKPDAVVIDVEGAELHVLRGLARLVEDGHAPHVWVSVHDLRGEFASLPDWYGGSLTQIEDLMFLTFGYQVEKHLPSNGEGERFVYFGAHTDE